MLQFVLWFVLHIMLPYGIALGTLFALIDMLTQAYDKANADRRLHRFIRWALIIGFVVLMLAGIHMLWLAILPTKIGQLLLLIWQKMIHFPALGICLQNIANVIHGLFTFFSGWFIVYFRAFILTFFFGGIVEGLALKWRISFPRALNVLLPVLCEFPLLAFKYFLGYETPIADKFLQGLIRAKFKENLPDSYEDAVQGYDETGKKFEDGVGGTVQKQRIKTTAIAIRRTNVKVKTAGGQRRAHVLVHQSRETSTDKEIENMLKGLGERINGHSIYFPADPTYSANEKGYVFDSLVSYTAGDELGLYLEMFENPFAVQNRASQGGAGALRTFWEDLLREIHYFTHLSPTAIYERLRKAADRRYKRDTSAEHAKYKIQQNLDLSVIPIPRDPKTKNDIDEQRQLALQNAQARIPDVTAALNGFGLAGKFKEVLVGGSTAIYRYALPPDPKLPNDFDKVSNSIGNLLHIHEKPIITLQAGILEVSMPNVTKDGPINIPVSFADMIRHRKQGASCIISGMAGVDALGNPIYFELGDKNPHAILFGKTGTGKTVTIFTILYSVMSATDPDHLKIAFVDGKGNSFEFMKLDYDDPDAHPNPFLYAPPADASGDIEYARALIKHMESETRRRIELFKEAQVAKLAEYNAKYPDKALPEILFVCDEFSAITQKDRDLKPSEAVKKNTIDKFEYIAKMSRSVGIRMLLANQSARKELVSGKISANITGRLSLGVSEPIESEIALPETGIKVHLISQPGEFYSIMNGPTHPEHGNSPYIPPSVAKKLNDRLTDKFGRVEYVMTREQIMAAEGFSDDQDKPQAPKDSFPSGAMSRQTTVAMRPVRKMNAAKEKGTINIDKVPAPNPIPTVQTPLIKIAQLDSQYTAWLSQHPEVYNKNQELAKQQDLELQGKAQQLLADIRRRVRIWQETQDVLNKPTTRATAGNAARLIRETIKR